MSTNFDVGWTVPPNDYSLTKCMFREDRFVDGPYIDELKILSSRPYKKFYSFNLRVRYTFDADRWASTRYGEIPPEVIIGPSRTNLLRFNLFVPGNSYHHAKNQAVIWINSQTKYDQSTGLKRYFHLYTNRHFRHHYKQCFSGQKQKTSEDNFTFFHLVRRSFSYILKIISFGLIEDEK